MRRHGCEIYAEEVDGVSSLKYIDYEATGKDTDHGQYWDDEIEHMIVQQIEYDEEHDTPFI
jgi:hypothetical protein